MEKEKVLKVMNEWKKFDLSTELRYEKQNLDSIERRIDEYKNELIKFYERKRKSRANISALENRSIEKFDFTSDIQALLDHKSVTKLQVIDKTLYVYTDYINIHDSDGNTFAGNKYRLEFYYEDMECKVFGLDESRNRKSWWHYNDDNRYLDPHPHVNGRKGTPCWGSAGEMLTYNMNEYEIYASYIVVYNFLQQVNLDDSAGEFIKNWDCIDEDGDVIDNPYTSDMRICKVCDCEIDVDNDSVSYCEYCDEYVCDDCATWIESESRYVCDSCIDSHYDRCSECDELVCEDDLVTCEDCGEQVCDEHRTYADDHYYCDTCYSNRFTYCDGCGEDRDRETMFTCEECGETKCTECDVKHEYCGETLCDDCYEEKIEEEDEENEE